MLTLSSNEAATDSQSLPEMSAPTFLVMRLPFIPSRNGVILCFKMVLETTRILKVEDPKDKQ